MSTTDPTTAPTTTARDTGPGHRLVETETTTLMGVTEQLVAPTHMALAEQLHAYEAAAPCFMSSHSVPKGQREE